MSKVETSNTWEEGLVMDLNPLSTPNNVLTDCVNGTFITYNGNEFSLQNDQGNYKLEYCRLTPNYIPVGIKEYGDILYIVSQNPLTNEVEIGSYPSPLMITTPDEKFNNNEFESIINSQILEKELTEGNYTELMENANSIIFNGDDYKLNPGDEYCLQIEGDKIPYKYETIEYHILDEDSNTHVITDKIELDEDGNPKDYKHVAWTVPGWLSIKARLAELSVAGINIRSFYVPKTENDLKTAHFAFNLRLNVNDTYLIKKKDDKSILDNWCDGIDQNKLNDVRFRIFIEKETDGKFVSIYDSEFIEFGITDSAQENSLLFLNEFDWTEWYGDSKVLWKNISGKIENLKSDEKIRIRMIPVLFEEEYNYKIVYDNLEQNLLFDLAAVEDEEWNLGNELYQFYLSSDGNNQTIYTNISGPMISSFPVNLYAEIFDIDGNSIKSYIFEDYSGIGENVLQIAFDETFKKENIYVIKFKFAPSEKEIGSFPMVTRFLITSEVFNDFTDTLVYDKDVKFDEWIKRYWQHNKTNLKLNYKEIDTKKKIGYVDDVIYENDLSENKPTEADKKYGIDDINNDIKPYNTFFADQNPGLSDAIKYRKGFKYNLEYNTELTGESLRGDLWDGFDPKNNLTKMDYSNNSKVPFAEHPFSEAMPYRNETVFSYIELLYKYQKMGLPFDFADTSFWYFSDKLEDLPGTNASGKLTDYVYEADIHIYGRKEEDTAGNNRSVKIGGKLLKSGRSFGYETEEYHEGKNEKNRFEIHFTINDVLQDLKLPCLLVKFNYLLRGRSDNYELIQTIIGGPNDGDISGDFTFRKEQDVNFTLYYIAFSETTDSNPVLVPLGAESVGANYFKNFCKKISVSLKDIADLIPTDRYILNLISTDEYNPRLTIYNAGSFRNLTYKEHDLSNKQIRADIISKFPDIEYKSVLLDTVNDIKDAMSDDSFILFDKTLVDTTFAANDFPYTSSGNMTGINEVKMKMLRLTSNSEHDFEKWNNSPQLNEGGIITGLYCTDMLKSEDELLQEMHSGYLMSKPQIKLTAKTYDKNAGITSDASQDKWQSSNYDKIINTYFKNKATWFVYHNWWNSGAESDNYILLGSCLASDPDTRLDYRWPWIKHEI